MATDPWFLVSLFAFSAITTLATDWLVRKLAWTDERPPRLSASVAAAIVWIFLLFIAGLIAARYIERSATSLPGYLIFAVAALTLSLARAWLYYRSLSQNAPGLRLDAEVFSNRRVQTLLYPLFAFDIYLVLSLVLSRPVDLPLVIPLVIGSLLPDLDSWTWVTSRLAPLIAEKTGARLEPQGGWHSLAAAAGVALISAVVIPIAGMWAWALLTLGFLCHLVLDLASPEGVMLLWPATHTRYRVSGPVLKSISEAGVRKQALGLAALAIVLLLAVDLGPPSPPPVAAPSYEQTVERYYALRGKNLAIADVEGTWQATGRRVSGRFEILNARGQSFIMVDRYTGRVFTAGRTALDDMYLNRISLGAGPPVSVRATEIRLKDQDLGQVLPLIYEMQREPGLQHIYISGEVVLPLSTGNAGPVLPVDLSQSRLRHIEAHDPGYYSLQYLTAADLIELAGLAVERADLIIVATYLSSPEGPTATPLPSPPATAAPDAGTGYGTP